MRVMAEAIQRAETIGDRVVVLSPDDAKFVYLTAKHLSALFNLPVAPVAGVGSIGHARAALTVARMAIEQGLSLDARVAANGPTIGEAIALALGES